MAASTFDKRIIIDDAAADVLIGLLNKPVPPYPKTSGIRWATEEDDKCFLQKHSEKLSRRNSKAL